MPRIHDITTDTDNPPQFVALLPVRKNTTRWFRFKDDVVVRIVAQGSGSRIDVRSKSRLGRSDLGANAKRIRAYVEKLTHA